MDNLVPSQSVGRSHDPSPGPVTASSVLVVSHSSPRSASTYRRMPGAADPQRGRDQAETRVLVRAFAHTVL